MNITKQIIKKSVLVGTIALSIAVFAGCSDSANSSTADTTKPTEAQTTVQATEGTAKSGTTNETFDLKSLHTCKENDEDDLVGVSSVQSENKLCGKCRIVVIIGIVAVFAEISRSSADEYRLALAVKHIVKACILRTLARGYLPCAYKVIFVIFFAGMQ